MSLAQLLRGGLTCFALLALAASPADAQLPAGWKITGGYKSFWSGKSASRRLYHARDYAAGMHEYVAQSAQPEAKVVEEQAAEVLRNLEGAKMHFAVMRKDYASDKETLAAIDSIEKHIAAAIECHGNVCACCAAKDFQAIKAMECCHDMSKEIDAALTEHDALMRQLARKAAAEAGPQGESGKTKKARTGSK